MSSQLIHTSLRGTLKQINGVPGTRPPTATHSSHLKCRNPVNPCTYDCWGEMVPKTVRKFSIGFNQLWWEVCPPKSCRYELVGQKRLSIHSWLNCYNIDDCHLSGIIRTFGAELISLISAGIGQIDSIWQSGEQRCRQSRQVQSERERYDNGRVCDVPRKIFLCSLMTDIVLSVGLHILYPSLHSASWHTEFARKLGAHHSQISVRIYPYLVKFTWKESSVDREPLCVSKNRIM